MALPVEVLRAMLEGGASSEVILAAAEAWEAREKRERDEAKSEALDGRLPAYIRPAVRQEVIARDGRTCTYCGRAVLVAHLDHVIPRSRGGPSTAENLVVSCKPCNSSKKDRSLEEWFR